MEELATTHDVTVAWRSFELRPAGSPPMPPEYRARIEAGRPRFNAMARERYGVEINAGPFGENSRPALIGAKFAEAHGRGPAYHKAALRAYWQEARPIGDVAVLAQIAAAAGLDPDAFLAGLSDPRYEQEVLADIAQAREYGLTGVPALVFDERYLVSGAQPTEVLRQVCDQILAEREGQASDG